MQVGGLVRVPGSWFKCDPHLLAFETIWGVNYQIEHLSLSVKNQWLEQKHVCHEELARQFFERPRRRMLQTGGWTGAKEAEGGASTASGSSSVCGNWGPQEQGVKMTVSIKYLPLAHRSSLAQCIGKCLLKGTVRAENRREGLGIEPPYGGPINVNGFSSISSTADRIFKN